MNRQFGALSGLAMVLIVINHSIYYGTAYLLEWGHAPVVAWGQTLLSILQALGAFAVPTFFFISGSFVSYAAQGDPPRLSRKFLISTFKHLIIPYIVWSIVCYILFYVTFRLTYTPVEYIKNLLVGNPFHFVPLLVFYYLLSPILIRIGRSHGLLLIVIIAIYQLFLIIFFTPGILGISFPDWTYYLTPPIIRSTLMEWAIYFPLGLVYGLNAQRIIPWSRKYVWWLAGITIVLFTIGILNMLEIIHFPIAHYLSPLIFVLLLPAINRNSIPMVRLLERVGRRTYGVYLTHLVVLILALIGINILIPRLFDIHILLFPLLFLMGLFIPLLVMEWSTKSAIKQYYRYIFG